MPEADERMGDTTLEVKLSARTHKRLVALGALRNRSPQWLISDAIELYLQSEAHYEGVGREDLEEWEEYLFTGRFVQGGKVDAWLKKLAGNKDAECPDNMARRADREGGRRV